MISLSLGKLWVGSPCLCPARGKGRENHPALSVAYELVEGYYEWAYTSTPKLPVRHPKYHRAEIIRPLEVRCGV